MAHSAFCANGAGHNLATQALLESNEEPQELDGPTRFKLQRVAARWSRGRTDTERVSAVKKLFRIARSLGWNLSDLLRECAAESPADWTSPPSA